MTTTSTTAPVTSPPRLDRLGCVLLVLGGVAFFAYGPLHPEGDDLGDRTAQLHSMLVDPTWYPAHAIGILAFGALAAGVLAIARGPRLPEQVGRRTRIVGIMGIVMVLGQVIHLLAGTQASAIAEGGMTPLVGVFMGIETLVNPVWSLAIAALAVLGGLTCTVGNRVLLVPGLVGGLAFALANATIAFTDALDGLFPVAGLLGLWTVAVGVTGLVRR